MTRFLTRGDPLPHKRGSRFWASSCLGAFGTWGAPPNWRMDHGGVAVLVRAYFLDRGEGPGLEGPVRVPMQDPSHEA